MPHHNMSTESIKRSHKWLASGAEPPTFKKGEIAETHRAARAWAKAHPNPFAFNSRRKKV